MTEEGYVKGSIVENRSPVARAGGGDLSEREAIRERHNLQTLTPTSTRDQAAHTHNPMYSTPVNKFTAKRTPDSGNLVRLRSCTEKYSTPNPGVTPARRRIKISPKAISMEDLTPTKRVKNDRKEEYKETLISTSVNSKSEQKAAAIISRFLVIAAWRRRRCEVRYLKKTLEFQVTGSERLRIQVATLKSLLDSDNTKVRLAMRELERLKQLLRDKEQEKIILEREKFAIEGDVALAEDRASEMRIGWHNCRNELEGVRAAAALCEHALRQERVAVSEAIEQRDRVTAKLELSEKELSKYEAQAALAEAEAAALRNEMADYRTKLDNALIRLETETKARQKCTSDCVALNSRVALAAEETAILKRVLEEMRNELAGFQQQLQIARAQLDWWPRPLAKLMGVARSWLRYPMSVPEAVLWVFVPARHGC